MVAINHESTSRPTLRRARGTSVLGSAIRAVRYKFHSDGELVRLAGTRDRVAFRTLVSRYRRQVRVLAEGPMADVDHAESALRDNLISAFGAIEEFGTRCTPGTWLYLHGLRAAFVRVNAAGGRHRHAAGFPDGALIKA